MKPRSFAAASFSVILLTAGGAAAQALTFKNRPTPAKECAVCHYEMAEPFQYGTGTDIALPPVGKEVSSERMCFSCHDGSVGDSRLKVWDPSCAAHKTGTPLRQGMPVRTDLPLKDGLITCMTCHTAHGEQESGLTGIADSLFLRMPNDDSQLCKSCHTNKSGEDSHSMKKLNGKYASVVAATNGTLSAAGKVTCVSCHAVHGAPVKKLTVADGKDMTLCRICHEDMFVSSGKEKKTPHVGGEEPLDEKELAAVNSGDGEIGPDGKLICYSCHKMHSARGPRITRSLLSGTDFCVACHESYKKMAGKSHDLTAEIKYKNADNRTAKETGLCGACHGPHTWTASSGVSPFANVSSFCLSCHYDKGAASKKTINRSLKNHYMGKLDLAYFERKVPANSLDLQNSASRFLKEYIPGKKLFKEIFSSGSITCLTCHDVHADGKAFLRAEADNGELCVACHEEKASSLRTPHGADNLKKTCLSCHKVHNSENENLVRESGADDGCLACHGEKRSVFASDTMKKTISKDLIYKGHNHPSGIDNATVFPAPAYNKKDGVFSCVSCHDPHLSDINSPMKGNFIRMGANIKTPDDFCGVCHEKEKAVTGSSHGADLEKKKTANARTGRMAGSCDGCHRVHGARADKGLPSEKFSYSDRDDLCLNCHREGGTAKDKKINAFMGHKTGVLEKVPKKIPENLLTQENGLSYLRCVTCHDPHAGGPKFGAEGDITNSFLKKMNGKPTVCVACHENKERVKTGAHGVKNFEKKTKETKKLVETENVCGACHTVHNSPAGYLMEGKTDAERCMKCHDSGGRSVKYVGVTHRNDVDVKDKDILPLVDGKISCKTCHKTHDNTPKLIRSNSGRGEDLCVTCHEEQKSVLVSKHNMRINGVKDRSIELTAAESACEPCHSSHDPNRETSVAIGRVSSKSFAIRDHCLACHSKNGPAKNSVPEAVKHSSVLKTLKTKGMLAGHIYDSSGRKSPVGDIECSTCHNPHIWSADPARSGEFYTAGLDVKADNATAFLKSGVPESFCYVCHENPAEWFYNFHSEKFRLENTGNKKPDALLDRLFKGFR